MKNGQPEINVVSGREMLTRSPFIKHEFLASLLRLMFATSLPCKGLCIYTSRPYGLQGLSVVCIRRLKHILADDGIRIGQLVDALQECSPKAVAQWVDDVKFYRDWTAKKTPRKKYSLSNLI